MTNKKDNQNTNSNPYGDRETLVATLAWLDQVVGLLQTQTAAAGSGGDGGGALQMKEQLPMRGRVVVK